MFIAGFYLHSEVGWISDNFDSIPIFTKPTNKYPHSKYNCFVCFEEMIPKIFFWFSHFHVTVQAVDVNSLCLCPVLCIIWIRNACCRNVAEYSSSKQLDVLVPMFQLFHLFLKQWSDYNLKLQIIYQACNLPKSIEFLSKA